MPARKKSPLVRLALVLGTLVVTFALLELGARALYVAPWYERLVAEQTEAPVQRFHKNPYGFRGPDHTGPRDANELRVLALGDSFTWGLGVEAEDDLFLRICEARVNAEQPELGPVEIFNAAIIGSLTAHWGQAWQAMAGPVDPDVLLIVFFLRDGTPNESIPEFFDAIRQDVAVVNEANALYRHSYLYRFFRDSKDRAAIQKSYGELFNVAYFGDEAQTGEWRAAQVNLARLVSEADARGCTTGFVVFPILAGLKDEPYPFLEVCELLENYAANLGVETLDLLPAFLGKEGPDLWVSPYDQHPNEAANRIAAEALYPFLVRLMELHRSRS